MKKEELAEILHFDVCPLCHDIMPDDAEKRKGMHGEGLCDGREAVTKRAAKVLQR